MQNLFSVDSKLLMCFHSFKLFLAFTRFSGNAFEVSKGKLKPCEFQQLYRLFCFRREFPDFSLKFRRFNVEIAARVSNTLRTASFFLKTASFLVRIGSQMLIIHAVTNSHHFINGQEKSFDKFALTPLFLPTSM